MNAFTDLRQMWPLGWWARLDSLGHTLRLPSFLMRPFCDRFEESLDQSYWIEPATITTSSSAQNVTWTWSRSHRQKG